MPRKLHCDFETASRVDIRAAGAERYARDRSTHILCMAWAVDDGPVQLWYPPQPFPKELWADDLTFVAHNAGFEQAIWNAIMVKRFFLPSLPPERWDCTAAKAARFGLPRSLDGACGALRLPFQKDKTGAGLIRDLCQPDKHGQFDRDPVKLGLLDRYCMADVEAERGLDNHLPDTPSEREIWIVDQKINQRGVAVDMNLVDAAADRVDEILAKQAKRIQEYGISSPGAVKQILDFCAAQGYGLPNLTAETVRNALASNPSASVYDVLDIRQTASKTSAKKFHACQKQVNEDDRVRDLFLYAGAHTWRWAGKSVQPQNLPKGTLGAENELPVAFIKAGDTEALEQWGRPLDVISGCARGMFVAEPGKILMGSDFSKIEAVGLAHVSRETSLIQAFRDDQDIYVDMAREIYGVQKIERHQRDVGKQAILGLGYQMGADRFQGACAQAGVEISEELAEATVKTYRGRFERITGFWKFLERFTVLAVKTPNREIHSNDYPGFRFIYRPGHQFLYIRLPSGRDLPYFQPVVTPTDVYGYQCLDCEHKFRIRQAAGMAYPVPPRCPECRGPADLTNRWEQDWLRYWGVKGGRLMRQGTFGGRLCENVVQALCRDLLAAALVRLEKAGFLVVLHVHDEAVVEVEKGFSCVEEFQNIFTEAPDWAAGWTIRAESWSGNRYRKA